MLSAIGRGIGRGARGGAKLAARGAWGATKGIGRLGWRGAKGLAGAVALTSGFAPAIGVAAGLGKRLFGSKRGGRGGGRGGGSSESETGLLNTSLLFQIRDEVAQIKGLLVTQQIPESERREREFEEWRRHRELLSAISGLSGIGGGPGAKKDGGSLAKLLLGLLALTGLAMLPKLLENIPSIIDGIQSFLDKMGLFLMGMWAVFKLLGKRTKAMKPPKPFKPVKGLRGGKTPAQKKAAHMKKVDKENAKRAKADAKKAKADAKRAKATRAATNKINAAEKAARKTTRIGGKTIAQEKMPPKTKGIGSRIGSWFAETQGKSRAITEGKQAAARKGSRIGGKTIPQEKMPPKTKGIGSRIGSWFAETQGKERAIAEGKQAAARRTIGGKTIAQEKMPPKTKGIGSRIGSWLGDEGKSRAITEGKQAAERARKTQNAIDKKARTDRMKARLKILNAEKTQLLEEQRASDKRRQGFDEDRKRTRAKILETRAQQIARQNFKTAEFPDKKIQDRKAIIKEARNLARLAVRGLSAQFAGQLSNIYRGLRLANINMQLLGNSIQKGMGGISPERGPGVGGTPKVTSSTAATSLNEVNRGSIRTGISKIFGSLGGLVKPEGGAGGRAGTPKVTSSTAVTSLDEVNRGSIRKGISKIFGSLGGLGSPEGTKRPSGSSWKPATGTFLNKLVGPGMGGGPGTGAGRSITTDAAVTNRLFSRAMGNVPGWLKGFAKSFLGAMKTGMEGLRKLSKIPGFRLVSKILIITALISQVAGLVVTRIINPSAFKDEWDFWKQIGWAVGELLAILAAFAVITTLVAAGIAAAAPVLAASMFGGAVAAIAGYFITDFLVGLVIDKKDAKDLGDPNEGWRKLNQKNFNVGAGMISEGHLGSLEGIGTLVGGVGVMAATAGSEAVLNVMDVLSGFQSPGSIKNIAENKRNAAAGALFTGGDQQSMRRGPDFGTWAASQKTPPAPPPPKVIPDDILLKKNRRDRVIRTLNREFKSHQKTMLNDPSSKDRLVPRLAAINQEILNLINAPLNDDKTHFIVNHQEIKDASMTTTTVTQSSSGFISYGTNINAHGFAPSGRY